MNPSQKNCLKVSLRKLRERRCGLFFYALKGVHISLCYVLQRDFSFLSAVLKRGEAEENILSKIFRKAAVKPLRLI